MYCIQKGWHVVSQGTQENQFTLIHRNNRTLLIILQFLQLGFYSSKWWKLGRQVISRGGTACVLPINTKGNTIGVFISTRALSNLKWHAVWFMWGKGKWHIFLHPLCVTLTQWSRACRKSKSSSVHSSSVLDLELTRASHVSRRSL